MRNKASIELVTAAGLLAKAGLPCLSDRGFVSAYLNHDIDQWLTSQGILPVAKDINSEDELYSGRVLGEVVDMLGPPYLEYLKRRYSNVNDILVLRARQLEAQR